MSQYIPQYFYALFAALLWAVSAPIISTGLHKLQNYQEPRQGLLIGLAYGLCISSLLVTLLIGVPDLSVILDSLVIAAGVFTYILGTGLYYLTSIAYKKNASTAAQFTNVKPLFTIFAAFIFFSEPITIYNYISLGVISIGIAFIVISVWRNKVSWVAAILGILLAASWSLGEIFVKLSTKTLSPWVVTQGALISSTIIALILVLGDKILYRNKLKLILPMDIAVPFLTHGVLSFFLAYLCFFISISKIGLGNTILITVFWPTMAFIFNSYFLKHSRQEISWEVLISMFLFTVGSIINIYFM